MSLPLPVVPSTVYAVDVQVKSADLNSFEAILSAVRAALESSSHIQETHRWSPINSGAFLINDAIIAPLMTIRVDTDAVAIVVAGDDTSIDNVVSGDPKVCIRINDAAISERAVAYPDSPTNPAGEMPIADLENVVAVMEGRVAWDSVPAAGVQFHFGFHSMEDDTAANIFLGASNRMAMFVVNGPSSGNIRYKVGDGTSSDSADAIANGGAIAVVADTWYTLRVEHHGANTPAGVTAGTAVNRFYVDGILKHESSHANVMADGNVGPAFFGRAFGSGPTADQVMSVGTVKCWWNAALSPILP